MKTFLVFNGQNLFRKLKKSNRFVTVELQKNVKMPHFDHFVCPEEIDSYTHSKERGMSSPHFGLFCMGSF